MALFNTHRHRCSLLLVNFLFMFRVGLDFMLRFFLKPGMWMLTVVSKWFGNLKTNLECSYLHCTLQSIYKLAVSGLMRRNRNAKLWMPFWGKAIPLWSACSWLGYKEILQDLKCRTQSSSSFRPLSYVAKLWNIRCIVWKANYWLWLFNIQFEPMKSPCTQTLTWHFLRIDFTFLVSILESHFWCSNT